MVLKRLLQKAEGLGRYSWDEVLVVQLFVRTLSSPLGLLNCMYRVALRTDTQSWYEQGDGRKWCAFNASLSTWMLLTLDLQ